MAQTVERQCTDVFHVTSRQTNDGILANLVMVQAINICEGRNDYIRFVGGIRIASTAVIVQSHSNRTSALETLYGW